MGLGLGDIVGGIGGLFGDIVGDGDRQRAAGYYDQARQGYERLDPTIQARQVNSAYGTVDPAGRAAQLDALSQLQNQYRNGGMDAVTKNNLAEAQNNGANVARTAQAGVAQDAARRGLGNSATSLMQQQLAGSQGANLANQQGLQAAALGQQGRMAALSGASGLAGQVRGQDYQQADAQDAIARFNAANSMNAQQASFGNAAQRAGGIAGQYGQQAGQANADANRTRDRWAAGGQMVGGIGDMITDPTGGFAKSVTGGL